MFRRLTVAVVFVAATFQSADAAPAAGSSVCDGARRELLYEVWQRVWDLSWRRVRLYSLQLFQCRGSQMIIVRNTGVIVAALFLANPACAAPAALLNKSITVSYTTTIPGKKDDGSPVTGSRIAVRTIYISSAGRMFARVFRRDGNAAQTREAGPGEPANTLRFVGDKLVGIMQFASGASQMTISFDAGGQSCGAVIVAGRDSGRPIRWKGVDGSMRESTGPVTFSNISCSIASGNAFGSG